MEEIGWSTGDNLAHLSPLPLAPSLLLHSLPSSFPNPGNLRSRRSHGGSPGVEQWPCRSIMLPVPSHALLEYLETKQAEESSLNDSRTLFSQRGKPQNAAPGTAHCPGRKETHGYHEEASGAVLVGHRGGCPLHKILRGAKFQFHISTGAPKPCH